MRDGLRQASLLLLIAAIAGCVPEPRAHQVGPLAAAPRIGILPLSNYTADRDASDRMRPMLAAELGTRSGIALVDPGAVEAALAQEPWLLFDRIPPELLDRLGQQLSADALLVGAILGSGYRQDGSEQVPHVSYSLRLLQVPGGRVLWGVVHSRDGTDGEWLFGFGRVHNLEQLLERSIVESLKTFPSVGVADSMPGVSESGARR